VRADRVTTIRVRSDPANLATIRRFVRDEAAALRADPAVVPDVVQAVDESVTNIMVHGYRDSEGEIEIEVRREGDALVFVLRDRAPSFDPRTVPTPDLTARLWRRPLGGMGVHLTREIIEEVDHRVTPDWSNELVLIKRAAFKPHDMEA
jgi:anti-sigma regulatory factor (Ser/Thr protein kinase)